MGRRKKRKPEDNRTTEEKLRSCIKKLKAKGKTDAVAKEICEKVLKIKSK